MATKKKSPYIDEIPFNVAGIPCLIGVTHYHKVKGDSSTWDSDMDYHGYVECEFTVCDRRGRPAPWLERKLTDNDTNRIEREIAEQLND